MFLLVENFSQRSERHLAPAKHKSPPRRGAVENCFIGPLGPRKYYTMPLTENIVKAVKIFYDSRNKSQKHNLQIPVRNSGPLRRASAGWRFLVPGRRAGHLVRVSGPSRRGRVQSAGRSSSVPPTQTRTKTPERRVTLLAREQRRLIRRVVRKKFLVNTLIISKSDKVRKGAPPGASKLLNYYEHEIIKAKSTLICKSIYLILYIYPSPPIIKE